MKHCLLVVIAMLLLSCTDPGTTSEQKSGQPAFPEASVSTVPAVDTVTTIEESVEATPNPLIHEQCYCDSIPDELLPYIIKGYQVREYAAGDLNRDKLQDYLLLLSLPYKEDEPDETELRPLLILTRDNNNKLKLVARNDRVVDGCQDCGAQFGDYFDEMVIDSAGGFSVYHLGGMAWRSRNDISFNYSPSDKNWLLAEESSYNYNSGMTEGDTLYDGTIYMPEETIKTPNDFGKILFGDYGKVNRQ